MNLTIHLGIYFLLVSILLFASLIYNPRSWLHRMPPEVVSKVPPRTPEEKRIVTITGMPFLIALIVYPIVYVLVQHNPNYLYNFLVLCAFFIGFTLWDTFILDMVVVCKITPRSMIVPGTTREDYRNMKYHLRGITKGGLFSLIFSAILAGILTLIIAL